VLREVAVVISVECLAALDHLIWLRTGQRAAEALDCVQPTISRNSRKCLEVFELKLQRSRGEWRVLGDSELLNLERQVHQQLRWSRHHTLRLEAQHWSAPILDGFDLPGWRLGNVNQLEHEQPLALLEQGVIDAWLCSAPDAPVRSGLCALRLTTMPMHLMVPTSHPLAERRGSIPWEALLPYPVLPMPSGAFPIFERMLEQCLLLPSPERDQAMRQAPWWGRQPLEDLLIGYASPLTEGLYGNGWVRLDQALPVEVGDVLLVREAFRDHPRTNELLQHLLEQISQLSAGHPEVAIHRDTNAYVV
jgi:DNA-binding transcriptional LysR family regulator